MAGTCSTFSHPLFVGLHEIDWDGKQLWATATAIDAVLKVSLDGDVSVAWDPHAGDDAGRLGLRKRSHALDGSLDYRRRQAPLVDLCHVNGVTRRGGETIVNCGLVGDPNRGSPASATGPMRRRGEPYVSRRLRRNRGESEGAL